MVYGVWGHSGRLTLSTYSSQKKSWNNNNKQHAFNKFGLCLLPFVEGSGAGHQSNIECMVVVILCREYYAYFMYGTTTVRTNLQPPLCTISRRLPTVGVSKYSTYWRQPERAERACVWMMPCEAMNKVGQLKNSNHFIQRMREHEHIIFGMIW